MSSTTQSVPVQRFIEECAGGWSVIIPSATQPSDGTDQSSMLTIQSYSDWAKVHEAMRFVRHAACLAFLDHVKAVADNEASRPFAFVVFGESPVDHGQTVPENEPRDFPWSYSRHKIREAARRFLEQTNGDH